MPKKPPRNSFYFFMLDFKDEQRKKGINYGNMAEVAEAAGPMWKDAPPSVRRQYEEIAKKEKQKYDIPEKKYTSQGVSFAEIDQQERDLQEAIENEKNDIKNMISDREFNNTVTKLDIYIMEVNCYCKAAVDYVVGECTVLRFNILEGVKDSYHEIINPKTIPIGYASDVKYGAQELGLNMPDESAKRSNYMKILANIIDYLKQQDQNAVVLPPIFAMPDKIAAVVNFIQQMCRYTGEDDSLFRVYQLNTLFYTLINNIKTRSDEGFPKDSLALLQLKKDPFKYSPGIGCEHHEENDKSVECSMSKAKRLAYTVLDSCCPVAGVEAQPGKHIPADFDLDSIHAFQEQRKRRNPPSVAGLAQASCNTSIVSDTYAESLNSSTSTCNETARKEKRVHVPLRMPKSDMSDRIRLPPDLTAENFPYLPTRGRGRGVGGNFSKLKIGDDKSI